MSHFCWQQEGDRGDVDSRLILLQRFAELTDVLLCHPRGLSLRSQA